MHTLKKHAMGVAAVNYVGVLNLFLPLDEYLAVACAAAGPLLMRIMMRGAAIRLTNVKRQTLSLRTFVEHYWCSME